MIEAAKLQKQVEDNSAALVDDSALHNTPQVPQRCEGFVELRVRDTSLH